jgi:hypothetical protein
MPTPVVDLHDYLDMDLVDKLIVLENNGVQIGRVNTRLLINNLYWLDSFYVEVRRRRGHSADVDAVPFLRGPRLDKYLEQIDLSELL